MKVGEISVKLKVTDMKQFKEAVRNSVHIGNLSKKNQKRARLFVKALENKEALEK